MTVQGSAVNDIMRAAPRVSVISTFLNAERFIRDAIESVLQQDFQDFELILIDDGSTGECTDIARAYAARYAPVVRYFDHAGHRNQGISASRNLGIAMARGEFVAFIDADDVWEPAKLTEQIAIMNLHPELGLICGAARYWRSWSGGTDTVVQTGHVANVAVQPPESAVALYPLGEAPSPCPSDLLLRRNLVNAVGGFEEHFTGPRQLYEDQALLVKAYLAAPVYFSDRIWINYRQHSESCTARITRDGLYGDVRLYFLNWLDRYLSTLPESDERVRAALRRALRNLRHPVFCATVHRLSVFMHKGRRVAERLKKAAVGSTLRESRFTASSKH